MVRSEVMSEIVFLTMGVIVDDTTTWPAVPARRMSPACIPRQSIKRRLNR